MPSDIESLWGVNELGAYLGLAPKTITTMCSRDPERLPPRVAVLTAPRWSPEIVRDWVIRHSGGVKRKGGRPRG